MDHSSIINWDIYTNHYFFIPVAVFYLDFSRTVLKHNAPDDVMLGSLNIVLVRYAAHNSCDASGIIAFYFKMSTRLADTDQYTRDCLECLFIMGVKTARNEKILKIYIFNSAKKSGHADRK